MVRKEVVWVLVALFATQAMATIGVYDTVYNADQLPDVFASGTLLASGSIGVRQESIVDIGDGNNAWQAIAGWPGNGTFMGSKEGVYDAKQGAYSSIEFRLKVITQPNPAYEVTQVFIADNHYATESKWKIRGFLFASDYIVERGGAGAGGQGEKVMFDTASDFVTYRMDYTSATAIADLYYFNGTDWTYLLSSATGSDLNANLTDRFRIGQDSANYVGTFQLDYVAWGQVPEPATLALLGLGSLVVLKRKRI